MKKILIALALLQALALSIIPQLAFADSTRNPCYNTNGANQYGNCVGVGTAAPLPTVSTAPASIQGNATGSTGAVVGTLAAAAGKTTFICDFDVSGIGGTAALGPITVAGLLGGSKVYQLTSPGYLSKNFDPCIPASAVNTAITITTTADGTATAVDVNSTGYQK